MRSRRYSLFQVLFVTMAGVAMFGVALQMIETVSRDELLKADEWLGKLASVIIVVGTTIGAIWVTLQLALRPIRRLSQRADSIGPNSLHQRLPIEDAPAEIAPLVASFNASLDRLEAAWSAHRAFSSNAAHELRMPLAALRAHVESLLPAGERRVATAEFDRLGRVIEQLLYLAEADQDHLVCKEPFDLVTLARETAMLAAPKIIAGGHDISFESGIQTYPCEGDSLLASIALRNLLENARKHTPQGTRIAVSVADTGVVTVSDNGPGVPDQFESRLFERFSRSDPQGDGAGLGLSIVARVMALHSGRSWYERRRVGAAFHLAFPAADNADGTVPPQPA